MEKVRTAVIVADIQRDFVEMADGALAVPGTGRDYIDRVIAATQRLRDAGLLILATQDWHPPGHISFFTNHPGKKAFDSITIQGRQQVLWPPHCVQGTDGAELLLPEELVDAVVRKGTENFYESYSAFQDEGGHRTRLHALLQKRDISRTVIYGVATDYCVKATVLDALDLGYEATVITELIRGISPETTEQALDGMVRRGADRVDGIENIVRNEP
jgi:nicotinamidase/pyrazinamidase